MIETFLRRLRSVVRGPWKLGGYLRWQINRRFVRRVVVGSEVHFAYRGGLYADTLNRGNASSHVAERALRYCVGTGIDIGASEWPLPGSIPVYDEPHQNAYKLDSFPDASLDYVFSSHCLEHLDRWRDALRLWIRKLRPGGYLFLYLPHESMKMWRKYGPWVGLGHRWIPTYQVLVPYLKGEGMDVVEFDKGRDEYWSFCIVSTLTMPAVAGARVRTPSSARTARAGTPGAGAG